MKYIDMVSEFEGFGFILWGDFDYAQSPGIVHPDSSPFLL
jgi:hypothetical protein